MIGKVGTGASEGIRNPERLKLWCTETTDAGLVHLEGLTKLEELDLENVQVIDAGVRELQKMLPNCEITR